MIRADFNFSEAGIKKACGYVLGESNAVWENGKIVAIDFKPVKVILQKLICRGFPDFKKLEEKAIENCNICIK